MTVTELEVLALEMRALAAEQRAGFAELRVTLATIVDAIADFRREYEQHTHG